MTSKLPRTHASSFKSRAQTFNIQTRQKKLPPKPTHWVNKKAQGLIQEFLDGSGRDEMWGTFGPIRAQWSESSPRVGCGGLIHNGPSKEAIARKICSQQGHMDMKSALSKHNTWLKSRKVGNGPYGRHPGKTPVLHIANNGKVGYHFNRVTIIKMWNGDMECQALQ